METTQTPQSKTFNLHALPLLCSTLTPTIQNKIKTGFLYYKTKTKPYLSGIYSYNVCFTFQIFEFLIFRIRFIAKLGGKPIYAPSEQLLSVLACHSVAMHLRL